MLTLDHIAVLGETLEEAAAHVEALLGATMLPGGKHARFGTHNQLLGMAPDLYLEAIAIDPNAPAPTDARWFGLDHFRGKARLNKWICRVDDMQSALAALPMAGRSVSLTRGDLSWTMAVPEDGKLPFDGLFPALIQWHSPVIPGKLLPAGALSFKGLTITHPEAEALETLLTPHLDQGVEPQIIRFDTGPARLMAQIETAQGTVELT